MQKLFSSLHFASLRIPSHFFISLTLLQLFFSLKIKEPYQFVNISIQGLKSSCYQCVRLAVVVSCVRKCNLFVSYGLKNIRALQLETNLVNTLTTE